jgi:polysaccharide pyruvyl transferase WcaK-like protein
MSTFEVVESVADSPPLLDYVVACRFHGVVFAQFAQFGHLPKKPALAVSNNPKVTGLMREIRPSKYCVDIQTFDRPRLAEKFGRRVENRDKVKGFGQGPNSMSRGRSIHIHGEYGVAQ